MLDNEDQTEAQEIEELNRLFNEGETVDKGHFAEQRTNILIYKSDFFKKKGAQIRELGKESITADTRLRLSENHVQVVCNRLIASITNQAPSVLFVPNNDSELADIKDAELCNAVRAHAENELNFDDKVDRLANNLVVTGEALTFFYFDPYDGELVGYEQKTTPDGQPLHTHPANGEVVDTHDEMQQPLEPVQDQSKPVFSGKIKIKLPHPFNVIRHKSSDNFDDSPFVCLREMISKSEAKKLIQGRPKPEHDELMSEIDSSSEQGFKVFDVNSGEYSDAKDQVLVKYWFFRKCYKYPKGQFKVQIGNKLISNGELPYGVWPINYEGFRVATGSCRAISIIKDLRPPQTHLNYLVSTAAFHMVAHGDDKVFTQMGTKLTQGATYNGLKSFVINGPPPTVIAGRDAGQFEAAIARSVNVIYKLADDAYQLEETKIQDPEAMLYARLSAKQKHSPIAKKFERLLVNSWKTYIALAKNYYDENMVIKAVGKREAINIAEFKNMRDDGYMIKAKPVSGTVEEMQGNAMEVRTILQYVGKDLPKTVIAKLVNRLPFLSKESMMSELLTTEKNIDNDILALDRGEWVEAQKDDDHTECMRRFKSRMKSADFKLKPPQVQQMYQQRYQQHTDFAAELAAELKEAEAGFWPMDGGLVKVDLYDANGKRMLLPQASLVKLQGLLDKQFAGQEQLQQLDQASQSEISTKALQIANQHLNQMQMQQPPQMQQMGMGEAAGMQQPQPMPPYRPN